MANTLPFKTQKKIISLFLWGEDKKEIAKKYNITPKLVTSIVTANTTTRTEIEKANQSLNIVRENAKIQDLKLKSLDLLNSAIEESYDKDDKQKFIQNFTAWFSTMDKTFRLNNDMATENKNNTNTNIKVDVAEILKTLKTPEQKKAFLLNQITDTNITK